MDQYVSLKAFGYNFENTFHDRKVAIDQAIDQWGSEAVFGHLNRMYECSRYNESIAEDLNYISINHMYHKSRDMVLKSMSRALSIAAHEEKWEQFSVLMKSLTLQSTL